MKNAANDLLTSIGNTPLMQLGRMFSEEKPVYAKMEGAKPGGSMKDRTSRLIISDLLAQGKIAKGGTIIESSSGNMAVGLAQACLFYGLQLIVVVDPKLNSHTKKLLQVYGARIEMVYTPCAQGGFLAARLQRVHELLDSVPNSVWSNQYGNPNNPKAYHTVMDEIMAALNHQVDYLFVATSTCGSLMGCADYITEKGLKTKVIAVDAVGSVLFGGPNEKRMIPGHGAGMPSHFLDREKIFDVVHVNDADCIQGCRQLLKKEAVLGGGSTGAIVAAYTRYQKHIPKGKVSVMLFADRGERYLDTIYNNEWINEHVNKRTASSDTPSRARKARIPDEVSF